MSARTGAGLQQEGTVSRSLTSPSGEHLHLKRGHHSSEPPIARGEDPEMRITEEVLLMVGVHLKYDMREVCRGQITGEAHPSILEKVLPGCPERKAQEDQLNHPPDIIVPTVLTRKGEWLRLPQYPRPAPPLPCWQGWMWSPG